MYRELQLSDITMLLTQKTNANTSPTISAWIVFAFVPNWRRRGDLNPCTAINRLPAFQASPFNHLGTSPNALQPLYSITACAYCQWQFDK